jgi:hypothetical protein
MTFSSSNNRIKKDGKSVRFQNGEATLPPSSHRLIQHLSNTSAGEKHRMVL